MTLGISSFATLLQAGDGATPENFVTIAEVRDISGPDLTLNVEDATSHDSVAGWEEDVATTLDGADISFEINYVPTHATHDAATGLISLMEGRTLRNFRLVFPDGIPTTWTIPAHVTKCNIKEPVKGVLRADVTLTVSGQPTLA